MAGWLRVVSADSKVCDDTIHAHLNCSFIDTESNDFTCYSCNVIVVWVG